MPVIVRTGFKAYGHGMIAAFLRLLTLIALVLMPIGMTSAPAAASPMPDSHHMTSGHCDDLPDKEQAPASTMDCAAMCSAIPAADQALPSPILKPQAPRVIGAAERFDGVILEIATPPPRRG
ncbi:MAG TPA: hypothetical protein VGD23_06465 [Sphingomicrobium sp.]